MLASSPVRGPAACTFGFGAVIGFLLGRVAIRRTAATSGGACVSGACVSGAARHRITRNPRLSIVPAAAKMGKEQQAYAATAGPACALLELRLRSALLVRRCRTCMGTKTDGNSAPEDGMQTFSAYFSVVCPTMLLGKTYDHALEGGEESRDFANPVPPALISRTE